MSVRKRLQHTPWPLAATLGLCLGLVLGGLVTAARGGHGSAASGPGGARPVADHIGPAGRAGAPPVATDWRIRL